MQDLVYETGRGGVDSVTFMADNLGSVDEIILFGGTVGRTEFGLLLLFAIRDGTLRSLRGGCYPAEGVFRRL